MRLVEILREELVRADLVAETKEQAIEELVDLLVAGHDLPAARREDVLRAVRNREASHPTGLGEGVAVPHGVIESIPEVIGALGIARRGIDFKAFDGRPASIVILLVIPKNRFQAHVKTLAGIARLVNRREFRDRLTAAHTSEEAFLAIEHEEGVH